MDSYINYKKAATYLEDREAVSRVKNLYCYIRRFATVFNPDVTDDENESEEVYLSGFCRVDDAYAQDFFGIVDDTDDIESEFVVQVVCGKVNGIEAKNDERKFAPEFRLYKSEAYVKQSELDEISQHFGIPKSLTFKKEYLKTIESLEREFDPTVNLVFYPDEEDEFMEFEGFYNLSKSVTYEDKIHGNTLHNAVYREEVLGAALAILTCDPRAGRTQTGRVQATKLREAVETYAGRFWKNSQPPLALATMEDLFRDWMSYVPDNPSKLSTPPEKPAPFEGKK